MFKPTQGEIWLPRTSFQICFGYLVPPADRWEQPTPLQGSDQPGLHHPPPRPPPTSDCTVRPTTTHKSSNHWLIHKFLNKQVLGPWRKFKISNFKNISTGFLHFLPVFCFFVFLTWTILKVFIEFMTILLLFYVLVFWPQGMWDLSSSTRDQTALRALKG